MSKIVLVEDEAILQRALAEWLRIEGHEIITVISGKEALEVIPKELPDLVLLDIILPELNGIEVLKQLKSNDQTKHIPVIILTNLGDEQNRKRALSLGADDYLVKAGHDLESVNKIVNKVLKNSTGA